MFAFRKTFSGALQYQIAQILKLSKFPEIKVLHKVHVTLVKMTHAIVTTMAPNPF